NGSLGDGTTIDRATPVSVDQGVVAAAVGFLHGYALRADGTVDSWGLNASGRLGDGTQVDHLRPAVIPGFSGIVNVTASKNSGMAVKSDGSVWSWGDNSYGELGDGTGTARFSPVLAYVNVPASAVSSCGTAMHVTAIATDGTLWTWGKNDLGTLGDGTLIGN